MHQQKFGRSNLQGCLGFSELVLASFSEKIKKETLTFKLTSFEKLKDLAGVFNEISLADSIKPPKPQISLPSTKNPFL